MADDAEITRALGAAPAPGHDHPTRWWCRSVTPEQERLASALGLRQVRRLHQMRCDLPLTERDDLDLRPFRPGLDDEAWLRCNNRAFAWHPDQGGWTAAQLQARVAEPWFEAAGFLLLDAPDGDALAGFCWTKFHDDDEPRMGEIFVIGVDPDHQGRGLGRRLTVAGLAWQWEHHRPPVGVLWVEHENAPALATYRSLGFAVHADDVAFERADA